MRLQDLAVRLVTVEAKLATLTGVVANGDVPTALEELDARLTLVEVTVDHLVAEKTQQHIDAIVTAPADSAPVAVEDVVALSPSANHEEAAAIVADVITEQLEADSVDHIEVAEIVAAAVFAVVVAEPEVVTDSTAITEAIVQAVAESPAPAAEVQQQVIDAVVEVVAAATGVDTVAPEVVQQVTEAVATLADPELDVVEARLDAAEAKVDSLLGN
jgi:hypothetical protein